MFYTSKPRISSPLDDFSHVGRGHVTEAAVVSKPIILNQLYQTYSPIVFLAFLKFADSDFVCSLAFTVCESVFLCMLLDRLPGGPADECVGPFETLRKGAFRNELLVVNANIWQRSTIEQMD